MKSLLLISLLVFFGFKVAVAQPLGSSDTPKVKISIKGLFQARYSFSSHKDIDVTGRHHIDGKATDNDFDIKRARLQFTSIISDRTSVVLLLNLADFKSEPKNKVLENAYISYRLSKQINFKMGQFRPAFGLEDMYPVDVIKSMDFSNQYTAFGNNGWQSFQIGASVFGAFEGRVPLIYELSVINGNNRNQVMDSDNGKHFLTRLETTVQKNINLKIGLNGGLGLVSDKRVYAAGIDLSATIRLANKWSLLFEVEAKQGNNHVLYGSLDSAARNGTMDQYQMRGLYILPNLRYAIDYRRLSSIEFSCRYEYFNKDFRHSGSPRVTWTPMISAEFLKS